MKTIDTLASDIKGLFGAAREGSSHSFQDDVLAKFGASVAVHVADSLSARTGARKPNTLYMSEIGKPCHRQLWYSVHYPQWAEPMQEHTLFKFLYGDLLEEVALLLAEAAGHTVKLRQKRITYEVAGWHIVGKLDAVIDGVLVDVKSASSYSYKKFQEGLDDSNDAFGYRAQLSGYNGLCVPGLDRQGFLAIDKQNGHIGFFEQAFEPVASKVENVVRDMNSAVEPARAFKLVPEGKSGNMKLGVECAYCPFKTTCWRDANTGAGLRAYNYSYGPVFLGTMKRTPAVPELTLPPPFAGSGEFVFSPDCLITNSRITSSVVPLVTT